VQGNGKGTPETTAACIDAETLAAWADGGLSESDAAAVETHLSDCERCTAMLATFTRTIPELPVAESLWTRWHLRWLVPAATAATVAALWVLVPRPDSPQMTIGPAPTTEAQAAPSSADNTANTSQRAAPADTKEQESAALARSTPAETFAKPEESRPAPQQLADERRDAADDTREKRLQAASSNEANAAARPPAAAPPAREADRTEEKTADAQTERFSAPIPNAAPAAPTAAAPSAATQPPAAGTARLGASSAARVRGEAFSLTAMIEVISPDPMTRWRVVRAGQVERSTNGGARWEPATLPESATLTGGTSPSSSICWLVGRTGSIYVTTDGLRFVRVPFPDRTDFLSIQATDGRRATVVTTDGRTMRTEDQGVTWVRISP
jgi:hypothetical protein